MSWTFKQITSLKCYGSIFSYIFKYIKILDCLFIVEDLCVILLYINSNNQEQ